MNTWYQLSVTLVAMLIAVCAEAKLPPLPVWKDSDKALIKEGEIVVGLALLTDKRINNQNETTEQNQQVEIIIEAVEAKPDLVSQQNLAGNSEISGVHLKKYFGSKPKSHRIDPQQLLSMQEAIDLNYALETHMEQSELPMYVYLFDSAQQVPEDHAPEMLYDSFYKDSEEALVIVYYYVGAPERTNFLLAGGSSESVPEWQVTELLWNASYKAREKSDTFDQLEVFLGQLSMRLFWIEELLRELVEVVVKHEINKKVVAENQFDKVMHLLSFRDNIEISSRFYWYAGGLLSLVLIVIWFMRRRLYFPAHPSSCRLGAENGAMSGGVLSYKNRQQPPSEQRKKMGNEFF